MTSRTQTKIVAFLTRVGVGLVVVGMVTQGMTTVVSAAEGTADESKRGRFQEVGRIPIEAQDPALSQFQVENSGWLLLSPLARRAYTVFESGASTVIRSFDIDTLKPRRQAKVTGTPIPGGTLAALGGSTAFNGELVHAVDSEAKRLYIPMTGGVPNPFIGPDAQRSMVGGYVLVIDEDAFDQGTPAFGAMTIPPAQAYLQAYNLMGMTVTRHHVAKNDKGKVVAVFAAPTRPPTVPPPGGTPLAAPYDHTLVQWNASDIRTNQSAAAVGLATATPASSEWTHVLGVCGTAPMTSFSSAAANNYQRGILATKNAIYTGCQSAPQAAAVVRVEVDPDTGAAAPSLAGEQGFRLTKPLADTMVDPAGERVFVRTHGGGATWWVFDAASGRFSGSIAASTEDNAIGAGIDPGSGRLYLLTHDTCVSRAGGGQLPVRGGVQFADAALDPVPAAENVRPDMAYPSQWVIQVDPVSRRVFVRRGLSIGAGESPRFVYPSCDSSTRVPAPPEPFYRVFEDRTALADRPEGLDDSNFTTNTPEAEGVTQASYLGSGSGYGSRLVLTGGLDALANGVPTTAQSPCGRDDRELVSGSVGKVEVSDQSTAAEAAGLDADGRTQEIFGDPLGRCKPQAPQPATGAQGEEWNRCSPHESIPAPSDDELAFDERQPAGADGKPVDANKDRCPDRDGRSRYAARCLGEEGTKEPEGFKSRRAVPRAGFAAEVGCDAAHDKATGRAEGALGAAEVDALQAQAAVNGAPVPAEGAVRVGRSSSEVTVTRALGKGIVVKVDSWARGVDIPGVGTIGIVRSEATSTATGRDGRAEGDYTRTICDVAVGDLRIPGCLGEEQQKLFVDALNDALGGRGQARLREPDRVLMEGTAHGFLAAVQRDRKELFGDQVITKDRSLAVPGLEIILYQGDGGAWGAGRQVLQLAGVQASTSYGIACLYGMGANGKCAGEGEGFDLSEDDFGLPESGEPEIVTITEEVPYEVPAEDVEDGDDGGGDGILQRIVRVLKAPFRAVEEAIRLAFNNPRELGLLAAVWALLFAPCWLGERRRSIGGLRARRVGA